MAYAIHGCNSFDSLRRKLVRTKAVIFYTPENTYVDAAGFYAR